MIFIVAVLATLLFPMWQRTVSSSKKAQCVSHLHILGTAVGFYAAENNGVLPPSQYYGTNDAHYSWFHILQDGRVPGSNGGVLPDSNSKNSPSVFTAYNCPANPFRTNFWKTASYVYNWSLGEEEKNSVTSVSLARIERPGRVVMIANAAVRAPDSQPSKSGPPYNLWTITKATEWDKAGAAQITFELHGNGDLAKFKSGESSIGEGHANFLMVDGHVETLSYAQAKSRFDDKTLLWTRDNKVATLW